MTFDAQTPCANCGHQRILHGMTQVPPSNWCIAPASGERAKSFTSICNCEAFVEPRPLGEAEPPTPDKSVTAAATTRPFPIHNGDRPADWQVPHTEKQLDDAGAKAIASLEHFRDEERVVVVRRATALIHANAKAGRPMGDYHGVPYWATVALTYEAMLRALLITAELDETYDGPDMGSEICPECGELDYSEHGGLAGHSWVCDHETTPGRPGDEELEAWAGWDATDRPSSEKDAKRFALYLLRARKSSRRASQDDAGAADKKRDAELLDRTYHLRRVGSSGLDITGRALLANFAQHEDSAAPTTGEG